MFGDVELVRISREIRGRRDDSTVEELYGADSRHQWLTCAEAAVRQRGIERIGGKAPSGLIDDAVGIAISNARAEALGDVEFHLDGVGGAVLAQETVDVFGDHIWPGTRVVLRTSRRCAGASRWVKGVRIGKQIGTEQSHFEMVPHSGDAELGVTEGIYELHPVGDENCDPEISVQRIAPRLRRASLEERAFAAAGDQSIKRFKVVGREIRCRVAVADTA